MNAQLESLPAVALARKLAPTAATHEELMRLVQSYGGHPVAVANPAVPGRRGDLAPDRPVMLLGKSPAATETERGVPFQGPIAMTLRECLAEAGHDIEETHQTHVTYWRPRKDNLPNATQIAFSHPFIEREIELVRPRRIIALGAVVLDSLFGDHHDLAERAGSVAEWRGIEVAVCRNHGHVARFPGDRPAFVEALRHAMRT